MKWSFSSHTPSPADREVDLPDKGSSIWQFGGFEERLWCFNYLKEYSEFIRSNMGSLDFQQSFFSVWQNSDPFSRTDIEDGPAAAINLDITHKKMRCGSIEIRPFSLQCSPPYHVHQRWSGPFYLGEAAIDINLDPLDASSREIRSLFVSSALPFRFAQDGTARNIETAANTDMLDYLWEKDRRKGSSESLSYVDVGYADLRRRIRVWKA